MIQHMFMALLILGCANASPSSLKAVAVLDNFPINLNSTQTYKLSHKIREH